MTSKNHRLTELEKEVLYRFSTTNDHSTETLEEYRAWHWLLDNGYIVRSGWLNDYKVSDLGKDYLDGVMNAAEKLRQWNMVVGK